MEAQVASEAAASECTWGEDRKPSKAFTALFNKLAILPTPEATEKTALKQLSGKFAQLVLSNQDSRYRVSRIAIVGSVGRSTNVRAAADLDMVAFIKNLTDEIRDYAMGQLWQVFQSEGAREIPGKSLKPSQYVLRFEHGSTEINFLMARDMLDGTSADTAQKQAYELLRTTLDNPPAAKASKDRCIALGEALNEVMKSQHASVNEVIRLAKLWVKSGLVQPGLLGPDIPERQIEIKVAGVLIELVVLYAYQSLVEALQRKKPEMKLPAAVDKVVLFRETLKVLTKLCLAKADQQTKIVLTTTVLGEHARYNPATIQEYKHCWGNSQRVVLHPLDPTWNIAEHVCVRESAEDPMTVGMMPRTWEKLGKHAKSLAEAIKTQPMREIWSSTTLGAALQKLACAQRPSPELDASST